MLPAIAPSMSASLGRRLPASSAVADMTCPDWQYPHCGTSSFCHAVCTALASRVARPSIVVTSAPSLIDDSGVWHERVGLPSISTVHAPQRPRPQPYLVPVSFSESRRIHKSGVSGATALLTSTRFLLTKKVGMRASEEDGRRRPLRSVTQPATQPAMRECYAITGCLSAAQPRCAPSTAIIDAGSAQRTSNLRGHPMEAEQLNAIAAGIADLEERTTQLRRYL